MKADFIAHTLSVLTVAAPSASRLETAPERVRSTQKVLSFLL